MPSHNHRGIYWSSQADTNAMSANEGSNSPWHIVYASEGGSASDTKSWVIGAAGNNEKHPIIQPFSACFLYKRIS